MSATPATSPRKPPARNHQLRREGISLLLAIVGVMWIVQVINSIDSYKLDNDGIYPRNISHLWGILTAPFIHVSWSHLIDNTLPFLFMGLIVALRGPAKLAAVTAIVIVIGGLGTWLVSPSGSVTDGASGIVFGYATYLFARGFFDRSALELLTGLIVGAVWGGALLASIVPHGNTSWQGHLCGGIAGVIAAYFLAERRKRASARTGGAASTPHPAAGTLPK